MFRSNSSWSFRKLRWRIKKIKNHNADTQMKQKEKQLSKLMYEKSWKIFTTRSFTQKRGKRTSILKTLIIRVRAIMRKQLLHKILLTSLGEKIYFDLCLIFRLLRFNFLMRFFFHYISLSNQKIQIESHKTQNTPENIKE